MDKTWRRSTHKNKTKQAYNSIFIFGFGNMKGTQIFILFWIKYKHEGKYGMSNCMDIDGTKNKLKTKWHDMIN